MRVQSSITLISLLLGSITVGLHQIERLPSLKQVSLTSWLTPSEIQSDYFAHRGSGRFEGQLNPPLPTQTFA